MQASTLYKVRSAKPEEFSSVGALLVKVYSQLDGFPKPSEQPNYYKILANVGDLTSNPAIELLVATDETDSILGAVVYFRDIKFYGSGGIATQEKNSAGFRLLAVDPSAQGKGI